MKKIAFLFGIMALFGFFPELSALDRHIEVERDNIEDTPVLVVSVSGRDNFELVLGEPDLKYSSKGVEIVGEHYVVYGNVLDERDNRRAYDAFMLIVDGQGETLVREILDFGFHEGIEEVFHVENRMIALVEQTFEDTDGTKHHFAYFEEGGHVQTLSPGLELKRLEKHGDVLYLSENNAGYFERALLPDGEFLSPGVVHGLMHRGEYETGVMFHSLNLYEIEGKTVRNAHVVDYPGHYSFSVSGRIQAFTVHPRVEGIKAQGVYDKPVAVHVDSGHLFLNNDAYKNGELIDKVGHHTLRIEGLNGYEKRISFTVTSGLIDIENHGVYDEAQTLSFRGEGELNGTPLASGTTLDEAGDYTLTISGVNDYVETHHFTLDIEEDDGRHSFVRLEFAIIGVLLFSLGIMGVRTLKKP